MQVICTVYENTGFNSVNIPDNIDKLETLGFNKIYNGTLEINTTYLPKIRIKKTWQEVCNADYVVLTTFQHDTFCYTVSSITMLANDVAELMLVIDAYNSIGGLLDVENTQVLLGQVERYNISQQDDIYGRYSLDEPFTPQSPLELAIGNKFGQNLSEGYYNIVETVLDIEAGKSEILNPTSQAPNDEVLLIPKTKVVNKSTVYMNIESGYVSYANPISRYYVCDNGVPVSIDGVNVEELVKTLRAYGLDNSIINAYTVPKGYMTATGKNLTGAKKTITEQQTGISLVYATVRNKKVLYGEFSKIRIYSICSGNSTEFRPEDIQSGGTYKIVIETDPRANGKPVAYFETYKGSNITNKYLNCVNGLTWSNTPIVWTDKSGTNVDRANFETSQKLKSDLIDMNFQKNMVNQMALGTMGAVAAAVTGIGGVAVVGSMVGAGIKNLIDYQFAKMEREREAKAEREIFERNQYYVQPEINFPRSESVRDFIGNNFLVTQCRLSALDIVNYDNFLTRFGYNVGSVTFDTSMITNRPHFNYIKFNAISLKSNRAMWLRKEAESQLLQGVRLWHTAPSPEKLLAYGNG